MIGHDDDTPETRTEVLDMGRVMDLRENPACDCEMCAWGAAVHAKVRECLEALPPPPIDGDGTPPPPAAKAASLAGVAALYAMQQAGGVDMLMRAAVLPVILARTLGAPGTVMPADDPEDVVLPAPTVSDVGRA